ncbi:MAG: penicillin acylase family protein [Acidobacteria bacterium]|nr:penicillin acylase family protein [Acidobacteriota bacterium]
MKRHSASSAVCILLCFIPRFFLVGDGVAAENLADELARQAKATLVKVHGTIRVPGLQRPVTVMRDRWGVAHLYAQNQHDLFFAQGFVAAQDRLFQMELWRRSGQGRLAEILGPSALFRDINARLLSYHGNMDVEYRSYASDSREILEAFTDGINRFIESRSQASGLALPVEFRWAGFRPEPWKPEDCLNRMAAFSMTRNAFSELRDAELVSVLGAEKATQLVSMDPRVNLDPAPGIDLSGLAPGLLRNLVGSDSRIEFLPYYLEGSNNWAVSGRLTATGAPLLANDPHRVLAIPSLRYMIHLVAPGWDVIGAGEPALPGVALGHNQHISWGFTIFGADQQDLYVEKLNPRDTLEYATDHGWERMQVRREEFKVRGGPDVVVDLKFSRHGPVLWQDKTRALALRWVGAEPGTAGYLASLSIDRARNWQDFCEAAARWKVPSENLVYGDTTGNIGEYSVGLSPVRHWTGMLPVPGTGGYEWAGFIPFDQLPHSYNPQKGFIATANNKMIPESYSYKIGYEWQAPYRVNRITQFLEFAVANGHKLTTEDYKKLQSDSFSLAGQELVSLLREAVGHEPTAVEQLLLNWDGVLSENSGAGALYEMLLPELEARMMHRAAPQRLWGILQQSHWEPDQLFGYLSHSSASIVVAQSQPERDQLLRDSVAAAAERLSQLEGPDRSKWSWGHLHNIKFRHALDEFPGAAPLTDLGPLPRSGDGQTVGATGWTGDSFEQVEGASYRQIIDVADWDRSLAINTPGQSGQPASAHYSDLLRLWQDWQYFPLAYSRAAVEKSAADKLILEP